MIELDLHTWNCEHKGSNCRHNDGISDWGLEYLVEFRYVTYKSKIGNCFNTWNGTPHTDILSDSIKKIKQMLNIPFREHCRQVSSDRSWYDYNCIYKDRISYNDSHVVELISFGGFSYFYYNIHEIKDLNLNDILKTPLVAKTQKYNNMLHLLERLGYSEKKGMELLESNLILK